MPMPNAKPGWKVTLDFGPDRVLEVLFTGHQAKGESQTYFHRLQDADGLIHGTREFVAVPR